MKAVIQTTLFLSLILLISSYSEDSFSQNQRLTHSLKMIKASQDQLAQKINTLYKQSKGDFIDDKEARDEIILFAKMDLQDHYENVLFVAQYAKDRDKVLALIERRLGAAEADHFRKALQTIQPEHKEHYRHDSIEEYAERFTQAALKSTIKMGQEEVTPMLKEKALSVSQNLRNKRAKSN